jgi:HD-like signal output (HDOD) protein
VGFQEVYRLVGLAATHQICQRDLGTYRLPANRLWENAVATAAAAEVLALPAGGDAGLAYATGLLRTLGRVIIDGASCGHVYPGEAEWPDVSDWEKRTFGMTAAEVTTTLLTHWRFPSELIDSIRGHYDPLADTQSNTGACVLNLACGVAARFGLDLPGEAGHWTPDAAKLTLAGVTGPDLDLCAERARAHYTALCATVE